MSNLPGNKSDLIMYLKSVSNERGIPYDEVIGIFSESLAQSLRRRSAEFREAEFRVEIDKDDGTAEGFRCWRVVGEDEEIENDQYEISLEEARVKAGSETINPGDFIEEPMDKLEFNQRISMLSAKQYLLSHLRDAERRRLLEDLLSREEDLITGQVVRILRDKGDAVVEVMHVDCRLPKREMIPRESLKVGDRVQALIKETVTENRGQQVRGQQIILTRTNPQFLVKLFQRVVPEIEKGILEIVAAVRAPGNRAKIAVRSSDTRVDPIGTCVGIRGSRVQVVTNELNGERIDIIQWDEDPVKYVLGALAPAEVSKIEIDKERHRMDVLVEPDLMAQAIGKNGTNVRLASELTEWQLNLCTPTEYQEEKEALATKKSTALAQTLDLDQELARILFDEGFETLEHVAFAQSGDLMEIQGVNEDMVSTIQQRAKEAVEQKEELLSQKLEMVDVQLIEMEGITEELLYDLISEDILTLENLADLSSDELLELVEIPSRMADTLVLRARNLLEQQESAADAAEESSPEDPNR